MPDPTSPLHRPAPHSPGPAPARSAAFRRKRTPVPTLLATAILLTALLSLPVAAQPARPANQLSCDADTPFALFGVDTRSGEMLLRAGGGWLVATRPAAVDAGGGDWRETAAYHREPRGERIYGGSMGTGPIFAVRGCGDACLQPVAWAGGPWAPMGEAIRDAPSGIAHTTYDRSGTPWVVVQQPLPPGKGPDDGVTSHAWRLTDGAWRKVGRAVVRSSGASAALAAPDQPDAIYSGTVRFVAGGRTESWLATLPALPIEEEGVVVPARSGAAYLTASGRLLLSHDGRTWVRSRWTPWGAHKTRLWTPGKDYVLDLPSGDRQGRLQTIFIDRRPGEDNHIHLATWEPGGGWQRVADLESGVTTLNGQWLEFSEIALASPDTWVLLTGCVNTANGPGLALRTVGPDGLTRPRFLPLVPAAEAP